MTDTATTINDLYDKAYLQGFSHCKDMFKILTGKMTPTEILVEMEKFITEKTTTNADRVPDTVS